MVGPTPLIFYMSENKRSPGGLAAQRAIHAGETCQKGSPSAWANKKSSFQETQ